MKKNILCVLLSICICLSFSLFVYADGAIGSITITDEPIDTFGAGDLEITASPSGAIAIGKNLSTGSTYYYRVNGDLLANNPSVGRSVNGMIPADVAYNFEGENEVSPNVIVGGDNRTKVTNTISLPYSAIAFVAATFVNSITGEPYISYGTAWMISDDAAATAAHVIYHETDGWATNVLVIPGLCYDPPVLMQMGYLFGPYGYAAATELVVSTQWHDSASLNHDWGVLRLNSSIGNSSGYLGFQFCSYNLFDSNLEEDENLRSITLSGYAGDRNNLTDSSAFNDEYFQYVSSGEIVGDTTENVSIPTYRKLEYRADTTGGQSGAPVLYEGKSIGFHSGGEDMNQNRGTGITSQLYSFLLAYR